MTDYTDMATGRAICNTIKNVTSNAVYDAIYDATNYETREVAYNIALVPTGNATHDATIITSRDVIDWKLNS